VLNVGGWDELVSDRAVLGFVRLSWHERVIIKGEIDSEFWVIVAGGLCCCLRVEVARIVSFRAWASNLWDEVSVGVWLESAELSVRVWVEVSVVVDILPVVVSVVAVVASVGAEVGINVVIIILVSVAFWVNMVILWHW
jgi:hypothetical protein